MTETLLALVPTHGVWLVMGAVALSCLAVPLPASILVMAGGGFAAAGDLVYWQLVLAAWAGFVAGDQLVYALARRGGPALVARLRRRARAAAVLDSAARLLDRYGTFAIVASRTVLSPIGPYVGCLSGALRVGWARYSAAAVFGALCWSLAYSALGYAFAGRIADIAPVIGSSIGVVVAGSIAAALLWWLVRSWRSSRAGAAGASSGRVRKRITGISEPR